MLLEEAIFNKSAEFWLKKRLANRLTKRRLANEGQSTKKLC
jgi:hypothetical protein